MLGIYWRRTFYKPIMTLMGMNPDDDIDDVYDYDVDEWS